MQLIQKIDNEARERYEKLDPLIKFLERRMILAKPGNRGQLKNIPADYEKFQEIKETSKTMNDT